MNTLALEALLAYVSKEVDPELQFQTFRCFLFVAHRGSCTQKDVEEGLGVSNASASRNISYWTQQRFDRKPGKGFIMRVEDPNDRRYRVLTLTKQGRDFFHELRTFGKAEYNGSPA